MRIGEKCPVCQLADMVELDEARSSGVVDGVAYDTHYIYCPACSFAVSVVVVDEAVGTGVRSLRASEASEKNFFLN